MKYLFGKSRSNFVNNAKSDFQVNICSKNPGATKTGNNTFFSRSITAKNRYFFQEHWFMLRRDVNFQESLSSSRTDTLIQESDGKRTGQLFQQKLAFRTDILHFLAGGCSWIQRSEKVSFLHTFCVSKSHNNQQK